MANLRKIKKHPSTVEALERELHLKQLQINRLLNITQAINNNISAEGLYQMYSSFLSWEMGVKKMALFVPDKQGYWRCATSIGVDEKLLQRDISMVLATYQRIKNIEITDDPLIRQFEIVVPVHHKEHPIAYTFIGSFEENEDRYNKIQFITTITNIIAVAIENKRLFKRQLEQERLRREMQLASDMQLMLIPRKLPQGDHFQMASIYKPHLSVGGDYFDIVQLDDNHLAFCIADISGKGLAAALLMANFQASFHALIHQRTPLSEFIRDLNKAVMRITKGERFLTFFVAIHERKENVITYLNAGHNPPLLVSDQRIVPLDKGCTILGTFAELPTVEEGRVQLWADSLLLAFTDGLVDIQNEAGEYFDEYRLRDFLVANCEADAAAFNAELVQHLEMFKGDTPYPDDFTVLTCKFMVDEEERPSI